jgi:hypothetical protein
VETQVARAAGSKGSARQATKDSKQEAATGEQGLTFAFEKSPGIDDTAIIDYLVPLAWPNGMQWQQFGPRARIDLLPAGRQGPAYGRTMSAFNWIDFFERLDGRAILRNAREQLRGVYDYILIDSRTGVSDTSGICTVEMPDTLVVCFTLNDQSIIGASGITGSVLVQREAIRAANPEAKNPINKERPFRIFPVPMRVDVTSEHAKRQVALQLAQDKFSRFLDDAYRKDLTSYWGSAQMAYYPYYAFEEIPAIFGDTPNVDFSLSSSVKKITGYLTDQGITSVPSLDSDPVRAESLRKEIVGWFARVVGSVRSARAAYDQLEVERRPIMLKLLQRLIQVDPTGQDSVRRCAMVEFPVAWHEVIQILAGLRVLVVSRNNQGTETVGLSDPAILEKWDLLRSAVQDNRPFLMWRQGLSASAQSWLSTGRDPSALWRGKLVEEAKRWQDDRFDDLNKLEQDFLTQSIETQRMETQSTEQAKKEDIMQGIETVAPAKKEDSATGLQIVALDQKRWSLTANRLKARIQGGRKMIFGLAVAGAILETLAAFRPQGDFVIQGVVAANLEIVREALGYAGAVALALMAVVRGQRLGRERLQAWILARAASESFKREMYRYRASSGPYIDGNREVKLLERRDEILGKLSSLQKFVVEPDPGTVKVGGTLDAGGYISERVHSAMGWFRDRADKYSSAQGRWESIEYFLAIAGAVLGAAATFTHNHGYGVWVAVITTISGSVSAHVVAERYDQFTVSYRSIADRLTGILGRWKANPGALGQFVEQVEAALLEENQAWIAGADEILKDVAWQPASSSPKGESVPA